MAHPFHAEVAVAVGSELSQLIDDDEGRRIDIARHSLWFLESTPRTTSCCNPLHFLPSARLATIAALLSPRSNAHTQPPIVVSNNSLPAARRLSSVAEPGKMARKSTWFSAATTFAVRFLSVHVAVTLSDFAPNNSRPC